MSTIFADIGNSYMKAAVRRGPDWEQLIEVPSGESERFLSRLEERAEKVVACSVNAKFSADMKRRLSAERLFQFTYRDLPAETIDYDSPRTLGLDRYFACLGASLMTSGSVVVIDAGTACTIDYMSSGGIFQGGVIMPGLKIFNESFSGRIPVLDRDSAFLPERWPGRNSSECIQWGTTGAYLVAISGFLKRYREMCGSFQLYLTGGDAGWVSEHLEISPEPRVRPFLVFEGMEAVLKQFGDTTIPTNG